MWIVDLLAQREVRIITSTKNHPHSLPVQSPLLVLGGAVGESSHLSGLSRQYLCSVGLCMTCHEERSFRKSS